MTKLSGIKALQQKTKWVREEVEHGTHFIIIHRSKPIFEIKPLSQNVEFAEDLKLENVYTDDFIKRMEEAEKDVRRGKLKTYNSTDEFLKSL